MSLYPPLDFRIGCSCSACELGVLLWFTEDEHPARGSWQLFWDRVYDRLADSEVPFGEWNEQSWRPCMWQLRQIGRDEATPKPTAYKIC